MMSITKREHEVLYYISQELTSREIGNTLFISTHTVISHRKNLQEKLNARNTAGMVRIGFELGFLSIT